MKISQKSEYALAAILDLAQQRREEWAKVAAISRRRQIPPKFLELILGELKHRGFVASKRGADGGYRLAKPMDYITVGEILTCLGERHTRKTKDGLSDLWSRVERSVWGILDSTTFAQVVQLAQPRPTPPRSGRLDLTQMIPSIAAPPAVPDPALPASSGTSAEGD